MESADVQFPSTLRVFSLAWNLLQTFSAVVGPAKHISSIDLSLNKLRCFSLDYQNVLLPLSIQLDFSGISRLIITISFYSYV